MNWFEEKSSGNWKPWFFMTKYIHTWNAFPMVPLASSLGAPIARGIHHDCTKFGTQISPWVIDLKADDHRWPSLTLVPHGYFGIPSLGLPVRWLWSLLPRLAAVTRRRLGCLNMVIIFIYHEKWRLTYFYENDEQVQTIIECLRGVLEILVVFHENLLFSLAHTPSNAQANLNYSRHMSSHRASTGSTPKVVFSPTTLHTCNLNFRKVAKCCPQNIAVISYQHLWVSCRGFVGNFDLGVAGILPKKDWSVHFQAGIVWGQFCQPNDAMDALIDTRPHIQSLILYDWSGETGLRNSGAQATSLPYMQNETKNHVILCNFKKHGEDSGNYKLLDFGYGPLQISRSSFCHV